MFAKAEAMEAIASRCGGRASSSDYLEMAKGWRRVAHFAQFQNDWSAQIFRTRDRRGPTEKKPTEAGSEV
jgi:hypothetical protein